MSDIPRDSEPTETAETKPSENLSPKGMAAMQGEIPDTKGDWRDLGVVDVPVANLPMPEGVSSAADFDHHISYDAAMSATRQLPEVQAEVQAGKTRDDFWREDQAGGLDYQHGRERVYDLFYGNDPVKLTKIGDAYQIETGRHRVYAAKEVGLATIPAHVTEKME